MCCGAFSAISPLVKLLVQPDGSILIAIVIWAGTPPPPQLYPPLEELTQPFCLGAEEAHRSDTGSDQPSACTFAIA